MVWDESGKEEIANKSFDVEEVYYLKFHKDGTILINPIKISSHGREPSTTVDSNDNIYMVWILL